MLGVALAFLVGIHFGFFCAAWLSAIEDQDREAQRAVSAYRKRNQVVVNLPRNWGEG